MIYSRRHPLNAMNRSSFIKNIKLEDFLEFRSLPKSITTFKPDRAPARLLTNTCDGIHPMLSKDYIRTTMGIDQMSVPKISEVVRKSAKTVGLL